MNFCRGHEGDGGNNVRIHQEASAGPPGEARGPPYPRLWGDSKGDIWRLGRVYVARAGNSVACSTLATLEGPHLLETIYLAPVGPRSKTLPRHWRQVGPASPRATCWFLLIFLCWWVPAEVAESAT